MSRSMIMTGIVALTALAAADAAAQETWQLAAIDGGTLPALVEQEDGGCRDEIVGGTLALRDDGTWLLETREREVCGDQVEEETEQEDGRYTRDAGGIRFADDDGDQEDADDGEADDDVDVEDFVSATVDGSDLTVRLDDGHTLTFRR